jgi:Uma2 family endonuclease
MVTHVEADVSGLEAPAFPTGSAGFGPAVKRWTVDEYHRMIDLGLVMEGAPIELIDGMLIYKDRRDSGGRAMVQGSRHNLAVAQLVQMNAILDKLGFHIRIQSSFVVSPSHEPEPDGVVFRGRPVDMAGRLPTSHDAVLVIEVADSSLDFDRSVKHRMYATAAIDIYWIVNLRANTVEVRERPDVLTGQYEGYREFRLGQLIPLQLPGASEVQIPVDQIIVDAA